MRVINHYVHCRTIWSDVWDCSCNHDCPVCGAEIEPWASEPETDLDVFVNDDWVPEDGWPDGISNLEELIMETT